MVIKRGDVVVVAISGDYGKPRPAIVVQSDSFHDHPSVTIVPVTSTLTDTPLCRIALAPTPQNGLRKQSEAMIDKVMPVARHKIDRIIGRLDEGSMLMINRALALWIGFDR